MDGNALLAAFFFGMVGLGMFIYGKRAGRLVPLGVGTGLMVVPYFIANVVVLIVVCSALAAVPLVVRER
jgi:hypothetical protein